MGFAFSRSGGASLPIHIAPPMAPDSMAPDSAPPQASALAQMVQQISEAGPKSGAEALRELRRVFPDSPLTLRVAALNLLMRQQNGQPGYRPR